MTTPISQKEYVSTVGVAMTNEDYVNCEGSKCPHCGSGNLEAYDPDADGPCKWNSVLCLDCRSTWVEYYNLARYENLEIPDIELPEELLK